MIRTIGLPVALALTLALVIACKKKDTAPGPVAPLPDNAASKGSAPPDPTPPPGDLSDAEFDSLMQEVIAMMRALSDAASAANGDCPKMAASLQKVNDEHHELHLRMHQLDDDPSAEDRADAWMKAHDAELAPMFEKLFKELGRCENDPEVMKAMEAMGAT